jgi:hypothetical protein
MSRYETVVISHREYIEDVIGSNNSPSIFTLQSFPVNPGQAGTFPWLSVIAQNYLLYEFEELEFEFISTSAMSFSSSTNTLLGKVLARHEDDPTVPADTSLYQMENSYGIEVAKPAESWIYKVPLEKPRMGHFTVRTGAQPTNTDLRMYDQGFFEIATSALPGANTNVGQLFVKYTCKFMKPFMIAGLVGQTIKAAHYIGTTYSNAQPIATSVNPTSQGTDTIGLTLTGTAITFPQNISTGNFLCTIIWKSTVAAAVTYPTLSFTNAALATNSAGSTSEWFNNTSTNAFTPNAGVTTTQCAITFLVTINAPGNTQAVITLGAAGTLPQGGTESVDIYIVQTNPLTN